jgi:hypothetical protein
MATELPRPGVEVVQEFQSASPTIVRPTLVPFVCGPAKEIIDVLNTDGTLNANAKQGTYNQLPLLVSQSAFPSPRGNIAQVNVEEASIEAFFQFGGSLLKLKRDPGESFLKAWNKAGAASIESLTDPGGGFAIDGLTLVIAIDVPSRLDTSEDVAITFAGATPGASLTAAQVAAQINSATGQAVATAVSNRCRITSLKHSALSSVTIRAGGSANTLLGFTVANEYRVTGAGFRAQDLANNTTISPWVEWTPGVYLVNGVAASFPAILSNTAGFGLVDDSGTFAGTAMANISYQGGGSILLQVGDFFYADGVAPTAGALVKKVEANRFKLGTLNVARSIFDADGNVVTAVYDDANVNTLFAGTPFAPQYAWFKAENLTHSSVPQPAVATGVVEGAAATPAVVEGTSSPAGPYALTGLTLKGYVTLDGVVQDDFVFTFTGAPLADMAAVVAAIGTNIPHVAAVNDAGKLKLSTTATGALQSLNLHPTSTAAATLGFTFPGGTDRSGTGTDVTFAPLGPVVTTNGNIAFANVPTNTLILKISADGGGTFPTTRSHTFGAGPFANIAAVIADIAADNAFMGGGSPDIVLSNPSGAELRIRYTGNTGDQAVLKIDPSSTAINGVGKLFFTPSQQAAGFDGLNGLTFEFKLNGRPHVYQVLFTSNSLVDAVTSINTVVGWPVASVGGTNTDELKITSDLAGIASEVQVVEVALTTQANIALGFAGGVDVFGSGRPNPDFWLDVNGNANIGADILRNTVTGAPFDPGQADLYIQYKGLRLDVSPQAVGQPSLISVSDVDTLTTLLSPLNQDNPLGLGLFFALINAPGTLCTGMGVADAPAIAPDGTLLAYTEVANFIEAQEVYAIAPLTHDETVAQMFKAHVELMESPEQKGERILFFNPLVPTHANDVIVASGLNGHSTLTPNQFVLDVNPSSALVTNGINPANPIPVSAGLYLEITVAGEVRRYNVSGVNGVVTTLNVTFSGSQNVDGFYSTTPLTEELVDADFSLEIRGALLLLPGSTLPDKDAIASTVQAKAQAYKYRRMFYVFPDKVTASVNGVASLLEAYHACAAITGMCAHFPPQQGFTNMPMVGFTGVQGSQDTFSNRQLNVMAAGGVYLLVQDATGAPIISRMQLSTDMTTIEKRELSITKIVDFTAKFLRAGLRNFIGTFNITQPFLDTVSTVIHGMLKFLEENGVLISGDLNNIIQSTDQPDTVLVDVLLDVPFPCNYIRLTLVI